MAVRDALALGHTFFVDDGQATADLEVNKCPCGSPDLRIATHCSGQPHDPLDRMPTCAWVSVPATAGAGAGGEEGGSLGAHVE